MTSPDCAVSIASTVLAQSPSNVWTVTAGPTILRPGFTEKSPCMAPFRCMASLILGVDTRVSNCLVLASIEPRSLTADMGASMFWRILRAEAATSGVRTMLPPTITISAPANTASPDDLASRPPATAIGMCISFFICLSSSMGVMPVICMSMPTWMLMMSIPRPSSSLALATGSGTEMRSHMSFAPYLSAARLASAMVELSALPSRMTISAPDFTAISTSSAPVSMVFMSARMVCPGKLSFSALTAFMPSLLMRGVPVSIQSTPPSTASRAIWRARSSSRMSRATCSMGWSWFMDDRYC